MIHLAAARTITPADFTLSPTLHIDISSRALKARRFNHWSVRPALRHGGRVPCSGVGAAVRSGNTLVVTKLDRLARSLRDARAIADELTSKGVALSLGGKRYDPIDPIDPVGRLLFNVLAMVAEFERDLISMRTREGMAVARAKERLKGKQPKLSKTQRALLFEVHD